MRIQWNNSEHSIGIDALDNQHKELFNITNTLVDLQEKGASKTEILKVMKRLHAYTNYHFSTEEGLFLKFEYPEREDHHFIHKGFSEKVRYHFDQVQNNTDEDLSNLIELLVTWVKGHINQEDRRYAEFLDKNNLVVNENFFFSSENADQELEMAQAAEALWESKKLALRVKEIDDQHKELVFILQQVNDLNKRGVTDGRRRMYLPVIIKRLYYYSQFHFNLEEELMQKFNYPGLMKHKTLHQSFIDKINHFAKDYRQAKVSLTEEIVNYLKDWTLQHILQDDADYKNFLGSDSPASL